MIDLVYKTVLTIVNKENSGYITPTEFNLLANNVQQEIFREYFEDSNRDKNKGNRGLTNEGYSNLDFNQRQRIQQFSSISNVDIENNQFELPPNIYFIEDNGVLSSGSTSTPPVINQVIEEVERSNINYLNRTEAAPTELYPIYERYSNNVRVYPSTINQIELRYLRNPTIPRWTYTIINNTEMYDPTNNSFQDFELHESEFSNIVIRILTYFGINLGETEVTQFAEALKDKMNLKDNN